MQVHWSANINNLTTDSIAIDTNVFQHLMDDEDINEDGHITRLLSLLAKDKILLLVDDGGVIVRECSYQLQPSTPDILKGAEGSVERLLLVYWLTPQTHKTITVDETGALMTSILKIVPKSKKGDRFYVYVAFKEGRVLMTNDKRDIWSKRDRLKQETPLSPGADILTSEEAYDKLDKFNTQVHHSDSPE